MVLPLYLAMNASEMTFSSVPERCAWMACHFSSCGSGLSNIPEQLPSGSMLILNDRLPCQGHSPDLVAAQLLDIVQRFECESLLLDFQRADNPETERTVDAILDALPCPVAVSEYYAHSHTCPVFLGPNPLHVPLEEHLKPWEGREIWLEAGLCQEIATITEQGSVFTPQFPLERLEGGFFDETLRCHYHTRIQPGQITFTLFDTPESLKKKLEHAHSLGVCRAVGLFQELGTFLTGKLPSCGSIAKYHGTWYDQAIKDL